MLVHYLFQCHNVDDKGNFYKLGDGWEQLDGNKEYESPNIPRQDMQSYCSWCARIKIGVFEYITPSHEVFTSMWDM